MKNEFYIIKCADCKKAFRSDTLSARVCPTCLKYRKPSTKPKPKAKKPKKRDPLSISEIMHIADVYSKVKHKYLHYGDIVALVDRTVDKCVCCGEIVPEGRQVCPQCEKAGGL